MRAFVFIPFVKRRLAAEAANSVYTKSTNIENTRIGRKSAGLSTVSGRVEMGGVEAGNGGTKVDGACVAVENGK